MSTGPSRDSEKKNEPAARAAATNAPSTSPKPTSQPTARYYSPAGASKYGSARTATNTTPKPTTSPAPMSRSPAAGANSASPRPAMYATPKPAQPPTPKSESAAGAAAAAKAPDSAAGAAAAKAPDHTDDEPPLSKSALEKVRDVDGVQLFVRRMSLQSTSSTVIGGEEVQQPSAADESGSAAKSGPRKSLEYAVDPLHYRQLVKGMIPLRSSFMKIEDDGQDGHRKSVHFSDQSGYDLADVRNYDKLVRTASPLQNLDTADVSGVWSDTVVISFLTA